MTQDNSLSSQLADDQQRLEDSLEISKPRSHIVPSKLSRRLTYHQSRRTLWVMAVLLLCTVVTYPTIEPLLDAAFSAGNLAALTLIGLFIAAIFALFMAEKMDDE